MALTLNRSQIANLSGHRTINKLNKSRVNVTLDGVTFPGSLRASSTGSATVTFDTPGIYFGKRAVTIASHRYNNFTLHSFERLEVL